MATYNDISIIATSKTITARMTNILYKVTTITATTSTDPITSTSPTETSAHKTTRIIYKDVWCLLVHNTVYKNTICSMLLVYSCNLRGDVTETEG